MEDNVFKVYYSNNLTSMETWTWENASKKILLNQFQQGNMFLH